MPVMEGTVEAVKPSKTINTKYGEKQHFSFKVGDSWYTIQFVNVGQEPVQKGMGVSFKYDEEKNGQYTNLVVDKKSLEKSNVVAGSSSNNNGGNWNRNSGETNPQVDNRQDSIMRQSSLHYAALVVGQTLTSKSDLDQAAMDVVSIADTFFLPYAKYGSTDNHKEEENNQVNHQNQQDNEEHPFDDEIGF